jgi:hypothetical protein
MRMFSVLAVLLLSVCPSLAQIPLSLADYNDGTWAYSGYKQVAEEPSASQQAEYAKAGYEQMKAHGEEINLKTPNTMTAAYWPNPNGRGGTIILHSSITVSLARIAAFLPEFNVLHVTERTRECGHEGVPQHL